MVLVVGLILARAKLLVRRKKSPPPSARAVSFSCRGSAKSADPPSDPPLSRLSWPVWELRKIAQRQK